MIKNTRNSKGITLIALIVTIIVILILVGISIMFLTGENGILSKAKEARERSMASSEQENGILNKYEEAITNYVSGRSGSNSYSSNLIENATLSGSQSASNININVSITKKVENINYVCILFANNKLYKTYSATEITAGTIVYTNAEASKLYEFYLLTIDEDGGILKSDIFSITTGTSTYQWVKTEYPIITAAGIMNMKNADQYGNVAEYKRDLAQGNCSASDALPIEAWDGNTGTCVRTGTFYIQLDSSYIGKTFTWNQYWLSGCSSIFSFCDSGKTVLSSWGSDISGTKTVDNNTKYVKYWSNGHYLYEVGAQ